jgi:hypothetical protein
MMAALIFSRRKMLSKVRVTELVPAPDEPVIAMMGWRSDMGISSVAEQAALGEQRRGLPARGFVVVALDALDLVASSRRPGRCAGAASSA